MSNARTLYDEAIRLFRSGDIRKSIEQLEAAHRIDSRDQDVLEALGVCYEKAGRLDEAVDCMKQLQTLNPDHVMAHANLSQYYIQKGLVLEAEREQAEARRLSWKAELKASGHMPAKPVSKEARERERLEEIEERIARFRKVIDLDPNDVLGYFSLGTALLDGGRLDEACHAFERAVQVDATHSPSFFSLGLALESLGCYERAARIYEQGISVAEARGDMIPLRKMQARLKVLKSKKDAGSP